MIVIKVIMIFYVFYVLRKTESLNKLTPKERGIIYFFLVLLGISNTQIEIFNFSFDFLIIGIITTLLEILLKSLKITTNYIFLKIYFVILLVLLLYRGVL